MNQEACQKFDQRLNEIMDLRLDPNADVELQAHALLCDDCSELLGNFSELHTGLSGPNKIPISLLKSESAESADVKNAWINAIIIGALATLLFIGMNVGMNVEPDSFQVASKPVEANTLDKEAEPKQSGLAMNDLGPSLTLTLPASKAPQSASLSDVCTQIQNNEAIRLSEELPGFRPLVSTLDHCIEWLKVSLDGLTGEEIDANEAEDTNDRLPSTDQGFLNRFVAISV